MADSHPYLQANSMNDVWESVYNARAAVSLASNRRLYPLWCSQFDWVWLRLTVTNSKVTFRLSVCQGRQPHDVGLCRACKQRTTLRLIYFVPWADLAPYDDLEHPPPKTRYRLCHGICTILPVSTAFDVTVPLYIAVLVLARYLIEGRKVEVYWCAWLSPSDGERRLALFAELSRLIAKLQLLKDPAEDLSVEYLTPTPVVSKRGWKKVQ